MRVVALVRQKDLRPDWMQRQWCPLGIDGVATDIVQAGDLWALHAVLNCLEVKV